MIDHSLPDLLLERIEAAGVRSQTAMTVMAPRRDPYWVPSPLVDSHIEFAEFVRTLMTRGDYAR